MPSLRFDRFELDSDRKLLARGDEPVRITPRAFRLLEYLLRERPRVVSKRELLDHVWSGVIVEEANLKTLVLEIRTALRARGGTADVIRTAYGFGYAFSGAVHVDDGTVPPALVLLRWSEGSMQLAAGDHTIGRAPTCGVVIDAPSVSREHARLTISRDVLTVTDLGSKNGTFIGPMRIDATVTLFDTCRITIGSVVVDLSRLGKNTSTETIGAE